MTAASLSAFDPALIDGVRNGEWRCPGSHRETRFAGKRPSRPCQMNPAGQILSPDTAALAPVNGAVLAAMSGGDIRIEHEFIALYLRLNSEDMEKLRRSIADEDRGSAVRASHRIAGASRVIGAEELAVVCGRVEAASRAGDFADAKANLPALWRAIARVDAFLNAHLEFNNETSRDNAKSGHDLKI